MKKFELTKEFITVLGIKLFRIKGQSFNKY